MRIIAILALILGVVLAGGAVKFMYGKFKEMEALAKTRPEAEPIPTVMIAVAKEDLRFGKKITKESVQLIAWPAEAAPKNAFNTIEDVFKEESQRTVLRQMDINEVILPSKVTGFGEEANVAALLKPGMRAHTLAVDSRSSVAGFLFPGSLVDIYLSYNGPAGQRTKLLMEKAEIIAVDQTTDRDQIKARVARTVTLEVTPEDSQRLILAERIGQLSFNMRGLGDDVISGEPLTDVGISIGDLLGKEEGPTKDKVRVNRGIGNTTTKEVDPTLDPDKPAEPEASSTERTNN
jgi:pilus assembly protein CpaB